MQHTFHLNASNLTPRFIDQVRKLFGNSEIKVIVEHVKASDVSQQDLHLAANALRERFNGLKVDPDLDIARLADQVNS